MATGLSTLRDNCAMLARVALCLVALTAGLLAAPSDRSIRPLRDGWLVRQLETETLDVAALGREVGAGGGGWLRARMPAQVHDVLLAHGLIPDPHVSKNAGASQIEEAIAGSDALPLRLRDGTLAGCISRAHDSDNTLAADVLLENLAAKAAASLATRTLLRDCGHDHAGAKLVRERQLHRHRPAP